jgi:hypothetical protein
VSGPGRRALPRAIILTLAAAAVLLGACGKKGSPGAPPGREAEFTYPRVYPAPESVVPPLPDFEAVEEEPKQERLIKGATPYERSKTTTYGSQ